MAEKKFTVLHTTKQRTQLKLPMPLPYVPVPSWLGAADLLAIILIPLWAVCSGLIRWMGRIEPPPRALFTIERDRFRMELVARDTGERVNFECDPKKIVELRKNRFEKGLWINVRGESMDTYLQDIDDGTITCLADELRTFIYAHSGSASSDQAGDLG